MKGIFVDLKDETDPDRASNLCQLFSNAIKPALQSSTGPVWATLLYVSMDASVYELFWLSGKLLVSNHENAMIFFLLSFISCYGY